VPFGAVAVPRGEARTFSSLSTIVIVRPHPGIASDALQSALQQKVIALIHYLKRWKETRDDADIFQHRLAGLKTRPTRNRRWAPLDPIGTLAGGLLGLATARDVAKVKQTVNRVIEVMQNQDRVITETVIALNETMAYTTQLKKVVDSLTKRATQTQEKLDAMMKTQARLANRSLNAYVMATVEATLSAMEFHCLQAQIFEGQYLHLRDWAEAGHLTESLISEEKLHDILRTMQSPLQPRYLYQQTRVRLLRVSREHIAYSFDVPRADEDKFMAWRLVTVPYVTQSGTVTITPELTDIAMDQTSGDLIDASECYHNNPLLCWSPIRLDSVPCAQAIIAKDSDLLTRCLMQPTTTTLPHLVRLNPLQVLLTTEGETVHERCPEGPQSSRRIPPGTHMLSPDARCTIESSRGWSFTRGTALNVTEVIRAENLLPLLNWTMTLPRSDVTASPVNWTMIEELSELNARIPRLHELRRLTPLTSHDGHAAWIALGGLLLGAAVLSIAFAEYRWQPLRRCCRRRQTSTPPAVMTAAGPPADDHKAPVDDAPMPAAASPDAARDAEVAPLMKKFIFAAPSRQIAV